MSISKEEALKYLRTIELVISTSKFYKEVLRNNEVQKVRDYIEQSSGERK